jgi:type I restriction enzyme R subunit
MIQKVQDPDGAAHPEDFPVLNESEAILLLVDEAHRSHTRTLHARLMQGLPNCAQIGFTGTPILEEDKRPTHTIFGRFIDTYTLTQSQEDGMTVRILYEGRDVAGEVMDAQTLDDIFAEAMGDDYSPNELREIRQTYATHRKVLEARRLIAAKARDIMRHYAQSVMPDGFKAQVVAVSRRAAVRYQQALTAARRDLVAELEDARARGETTWRRLTLGDILPRLQRLEIAAVISQGGDDPPSWRAWTLQSRQDAYVADFKKGFNPERNEGQTGILVVCSMLLTGFDAPRERALYLDKPLYGYELLQAIARVNRTYPGKDTGLVVDYFGLAEHLHRALEIYTRNDITGGLQPIQDEALTLRDRHARVVALFADRGLVLAETEACVDLLRDARLRARFTILLQAFLETLNTLMHRPEALPYVEDAKLLGLIRAQARKRYRDPHLEIAGAEAKVRQLIDRYVVARGVDPRIPPLDVLDAEFARHVATIRSPRAQAAEMEFAVRHHIRRHYPEDPVYYQTLSERLEEILQTFADNWEAQVEALRDFIRDYRRTRAETEREDRAVRPFLRLLAAARSDGRAPSAEDQRALAADAVALVSRIRQEIDRVDFWRRGVAREQLRGRILRYLDDHDLVPFDQQEALADRLVETAKANHTLLVDDARR